jgi:hypothetical protein
MHPLLDRAERMLHRFATPIEDAGPLRNAGVHPIQHRFILQPRDEAVALVCASRGLGSGGGRLLSLS